MGRASRGKKVHLASSVDMADIGSNTGSAANIVEAELGDVRVELEEKGQGLADSSASAKDGNLGLTGSRRRELAGDGGDGTCSCAEEHGGRRCGGREGR